MFALRFTFPAGRYHATPWGQHVNEADVAWPPEPWRILRALIATWWRKGDQERWSYEDLAALIDALAQNAPVYRLPENAIHAHTRHYMPQGKIKNGREDTTLIFDAFARIASGEALTVAWPELTLSEPAFALAADLAQGIGYLGRAESWVECEALAAWGEKPSCRPAEMLEATGDPIRVLAPLPAPDYAAERARLLAEFDARERKRLESGDRPPAPRAAARALAKARNRAFGPAGPDGAPMTLSERLVDALTLDTADYQRCGWSRPPAGREIVYRREPLAPVPRRPAGSRRPVAGPLPTVARFVLAGRPRPRVEDTVKIGELLRLAVLSKFGWQDDHESGRRRPNAPGVISGRGPDGCPLRDGSHPHAFWLPEDADGDGEIDHVTIYAEAGFEPRVRARLDRVTALWLAPRRRRPSDEEDPADETGRREWRLALEGFGRPENFAETALFGPARSWTSATPFLAAGHLKAAGYPGEVRRLLARRGIVTDPATVSVELLVGIPIRNRERRPIHFHRFRSRGGERQFDTTGAFLRLTFPQPVPGPLALGYGSHFGLGLFRADRASDP